MFYTVDVHPANRESTDLAVDMGSDRSDGRLLGTKNGPGAVAGSAQQQRIDRTIVESAFSPLVGIRCRFSPDQRGPSDPTDCTLSHIPLMAVEADGRCHCCGPEALVGRREELSRTLAVVR